MKAVGVSAGIRHRLSGKWGPARPPAQPTALFRSPGQLPPDPSPSTGLRALLPFFPDDLASKANILIDPLELQAATMDDLDGDEEPSPAAAQVPVGAGRGLRVGLSPLTLSEGQGCHSGLSTSIQARSSSRADVRAVGGGTSLPFPVPSPMNRGNPEWAQVLGS